MPGRNLVRGRWALVDTSAFFAFVDPRDTSHRSAIAVQKRLIAERWRLLTTNFVVVETHALMLARLDRAIAAQFLRDIARSSVLIIRATEADEQVAQEIVFRYHDKTFSMTDAISFAIMERLGIRFAFSFDRDFTQYGLTVLEP
jgi:predicted nucleic acid-binding protein